MKRIERSRKAGKFNVSTPKRRGRATSFNETIV
jgi:hypothetical protein